MRRSSSPPLLYLEDDDDDDGQVLYVERNRTFPQASSMINANHQIERERKRKHSHSNSNVQFPPYHNNLCTNQPITNWTKRPRHDPYQSRSVSAHRPPPPPPPPRGPLSAPETILIDPAEYVVERNHFNSFRAFDWTVEPRHIPPTLAVPIPRRPVPVSMIPPVEPQSHSIQPKPRADRVNRPTVTRLHEYETMGPSKSNNNKNNMIPVVSAATPALPLPLPKPTLLITRPIAKRGRPANLSRVSPLTAAPPPSTIPTPPVERSPSDSTSGSNLRGLAKVPRQILNGTTLLSAFHDGKYFRCNICKFCSLTSSLLLQHLFTHMFICEHCSFYSFSNHDFFRHMIDKHESVLHGVNPSNPNESKSLELLYLTRCPDGTFALCMDESPHSTAKQPLQLQSQPHQPSIISVAAIPPPPVVQPAAPSPSPLAPTPSKPKPPSRPAKKVARMEKPANNPKPPVERPVVPEKPAVINVVMKHRSCFTLRNRPSLHALTLEYNICRERTIRDICQTPTHNKRIQRTRRTSGDGRRLVEEVAHCLRTVVNQIVLNEENNGESSLICALPDQVLSSIFSYVDLRTLTDALKLSNKSSRSTDEEQIYQAEKRSRLSEDQRYRFIFTSPDNQNSEQTIVSSLHSSLTNGESSYTYTKFNKIPLAFDHTHRFFQLNLPEPSKPNANKTPKNKSSTSTKVGEDHSKSINSNKSTKVDRNNNSITSSNSKSSDNSSNVIIID